MEYIQNNSLIALVAKYYESLERLARRILLDKERAFDVMKWAMEAVYEEGSFYDGPHLRPLLISRTMDMAIDFNKSQKIYKDYFADPLNK